MAVYRDDLEEVLAKASTEDKTVIIAIVNKAYVEGDRPMLDLFLNGFWVGEDTRGLTNHLLVVAADQTAFQRCKFLRLHCYKLETDGVDFVGERLYMSEEFIKMMWKRTLFLGDVLKRGYNFIFTVRTYVSCTLFLIILFYFIFIPYLYNKLNNYILYDCYTTMQFYLYECQHFSLNLYIYI